MTSHFLMTVERAATTANHRSSQWQLHRVPGAADSKPAVVKTACSQIKVLRHFWKSQFNFPKILHEERT